VSNNTLPEDQSSAYVSQWVYIQSALTDNQNNPYVMTAVIDEQNGTNGVVLSPLQVQTPTQLWQITADGRLLSAADGTLVAMLGQNYESGSGQYIVLAPSPAQTDDSLQWVYNGDGQLRFINCANGHVLNVAGGYASNNPPVIAYPIENPIPPNDQWTISPACPLDVILAQPSVPFPAFSGDQAIAYSDINTLLDVTDIRSEYVNLNSPFSNWQVTIQTASCPSNVQPADWQTVTSQVSRELTAVVAINKLFSNFNEYQGELFSVKHAQLTQLGTDAGMEQGTTTGGLGLAVFEGVMYTSLEMMGPVGAVLGNLMMAGINIGLAATDDTSISPDPFQVTYSALLAELMKNFNALATITGNMQTAILTDWGKMSATYADILLTAGPNSLSWPPLLTADMIASSLPGYTIASMQMLLPAKYQIYQIEETNGSPIPDVPSYAQWVQWEAWSELLKSNVWKKYWIADSSNVNAYPSQEAMNDVWEANTSASDFYQGLSGWGFARSYPFNMGTLPGVDANGLVITITNLTANPLTVNACPDNGQGVTINGPSSEILQPYGSVSFIGYYTDGLAIDITVIDQNLRGGPGQVASLTAHQHLCVMEAGDVWVDGKTQNSGYQLTTPICNSGSFANGCPGVVQVGIFYGQ
jgi:hypothetical protein